MPFTAGVSLAAALVLSLFLTACSTSDVAHNTANTTSLSANTTKVTIQLAPPTASDWPTYLANNAHSGHNKGDTKAITTTIARKLKQHWPYQTSSKLSN